MQPTREAAAEAPLRFGVFEFDRATCELRRQGARVRLPLQPARALRLLLQHAGELVTREELRRELWGDGVFVDADAGLAACINQIRGALGDRAASPRFVETLPRLGYRFIVPLHEAPSAVEVPAPAVATSPPRTRAPRRRGTVVALAGLAAVAVLCVGSAPPALRSERAPVATTLPGVVVLPIPSPAGEPRLAAIAETLVEGVIGDLASAAGPRARIASRAQTDALRGRDVDLDAIHALGADFFVAVTLRRLPSAVRVHAKLAHASGWILWSTDYDLAEDNLATLQTDVAGAIAQKALREIVPPSPRGARRAPAPAAVAHYAQANSDQAAGRLQPSIEGYRRALAADPEHLASWAGLAEAEIDAALREPGRSAALLDAARVAIERARAIDPDFAGALSAEGALVFVRDFDPAAAEPLLRRAVELDPELVAARLWHADVLAALGRFDAAVDEAAVGRRLGPLTVEANRLLGHVELLAGRYTDLVDQAKRLRALDANTLAPDIWQALAAERLGAADVAGAARAKLLLAVTRAPREATASAATWADLDRALARRPGVDLPFLRAVAAAAASRPLDAIHWLDEARRQRFLEVMDAAHHPAFAALRGDPRFEAWLVRPVPAALAAIAPVGRPRSQGGS